MILIAGGRTDVIDAAVTASAELYDPSIGSFAATGSMLTARTGHTATLLPDGKVLIAGGYGPGSGGRWATAELYDPSTRTFTATGSMITPHVCHSATLLANGKVLIAGSDFYGHSAIAELYDPATGAFAATGTNADPSGDRPLCPTATLLPDGRVLIASGVGESAEIYDSGTGAFNVTGRAPSRGDYQFVATLLMNGKVLVDGGDDENNHYNHAQLYDPANSVFTDTGNMTVARAFQTATLLPDGTVLIAGDEFGPALGLGTGELYDPAKGAFNSVGSMAGVGRTGSTATLLSDGSVLIAGGTVNCACRPNSSAELYHPAVLTPPPTLLSLSGDGRGQGAIQHADTYQLVSPSNPAVVGEALIIYATGLADQSMIPPQIAIGGRMAEVLWFGKTPGFVGLNQINVRVPNRLAPGDSLSVRTNYLGRSSNEVTLAVH
jgi:hypothetical protein